MFCFLNLLVSENGLSLVNRQLETVSFFMRFSSIGVLNDIPLEVPALEEVKHAFSLYFLVPGEYTLQAASVINDATDVLRARARTDSPDEPIFCRGSPFHVYVVGTA